MPKPEDMAFDIDSNLKIALAETLRRKKDFAESRRILKDLEPEIAAHPEADPMLAARYWRRLARLLNDTGHNRQASDALQKSVAVVAQNLPINTRHFETCWKDLVQQVLSTPATVIELINCLKLLRSHQGTVCVPPALKVEYDTCVTHVVNNSLRLIAQQKFAAAAENLQSLSQVEDHRVLGIWWFWILWVTHKTGGSVEPAIACIHRMIPRIHASGNLKAELDAHHCLAIAYDQQQKKSRSMEERKKVEELYQRLRQTAKLAHSKLPAIEYIPANSGSFIEALERFQEIVDRRKFSIEDIVCLRKALGFDPSTAWPLYEDDYYSALQNVGALLDGNQLDSAADSLDRIAEYGGHELTLTYWWRWISDCHHEKHPDKLERASASIRKFLPRLERSGNRLAELEARYLLMQTYELGIHPEKATAEWNVMNELFRKMRLDKSISRDKLIELVLTHHIEHLRLCLLYEKDAKKIDARLKLLEFWTEMFPDAQKNSRFIMAHENAKNAIARRVTLGNAHCRSTQPGAGSADRADRAILEKNSTTAQSTAVQSTSRRSRKEMPH